MTKRESVIRDKIQQLCSPRAGSIYFQEFEAGWVFGLLWVLGEEPQFTTRKQVADYVENLWRRYKEIAMKEREEEP